MINTFNNYESAEKHLIDKICNEPDIVTSIMHEILCYSFKILNPLDNKNQRSNYIYAQKFFEWLLTGEKVLSQELLEINPWVKRFVDSTNLPENFSASYGFKIVEQLPIILNELKNKDSRRAYINILFNEDKIILNTKTTHEFPCSIGIHFLIRDNKLHTIINMRSNNCYSVMPYDVYNFTNFQNHVAKIIGIPIGYYYHTINSAHIFNGDVRRILNQ